MAVLLKIHTVGTTNTKRSLTPLATVTWDGQSIVFIQAQISKWLVSVWTAEEIGTCPPTPPRGVPAHIIIDAL